MINTFVKCAWLAILLFAGLGLGAQEIQVSYQDGQVQQKSGNTWKAINIGDKLSSDATLKVEKNSSIEFANGNSTISINQAGTYLLKDILAARKKADSNGVAKSLQTTFSSMIGTTPTKNQSAVGGVRATGQDDPTTWMMSDTEAAITTGKSQLQNGKLKEALNTFQTAQADATDGELPQLKYLIAFTMTASGDTRSASKLINDLDPSSEETWTPDFILLKARLLEESFAWNEAIALLTKQGLSLASDVNRGPIYHFMLGLAWQNVGNAANAKAAFSTVVKLVPASDLGQAAANMLQN